MSVVVAHEAHQWNIIRRGAESLPASGLTIGIVLQQSGWHVTPRAHTHDGRRLLDVAFASASQIFLSDHVATIWGV